MTDILSLIKSRRSIFPSMYSEEAIKTNEVKLIIEAARWAPNHKKTEPWRYIVFHSEEAKKTLASFMFKRYEETYLGERYSALKHKKVKKKVENSACVIAIVLHRDPEERIPEWEEVAAVACSVQNMWLQAFDLGIGAYWSSPKMITTFSDEFLNLEENQQCLGLFYMGKWDVQDLKAERKSIDEISVWR